MKRWTLIAAVLVLCACGRTGGGYRPVPDTLNVGTAIEPNSLNPLLTSESIENDLDGLIFNGLTHEDDRNVTQPDLATVVPTQQNGGISKDGKTITYHLRRGVRWQDGVPFTSSDVKFTWQAIMNPNTLTGNRVPYDQVRSVDTPDTNTVVFHLKGPYAPFVAEAFNSTTIEYIVPQHLLRNYRDLNKVPFNVKPVGTGPYKAGALGARRSHRVHREYSVFQRRAENSEDRRARDPGRKHRHESAARARDSVVSVHQ